MVVRMRLMREMWFVLLVTSFFATAAPVVAQTPAQPPPATPAATPTNPLTLTPDDRILGNADAPITIIEYASLTCPHCAHFTTEVLPKLIDKWVTPGKAKLILRDYPLDEVAVRAAMIARCAPPNRFYGFVETFFGTQEQWVMATDHDAALARLALLGGMSKDKVASCLADEGLKDKIVGSRLIASQQLGVASTPTFFINGTKFDGVPTEEAFNAVLTKLAGS
jgi:protein-disulfide isomerase